MRPELKELPARMKRLPEDKRGYPIPWFVAWKDGEPVFQAMDAHKWLLAVQEKLCWVCGVHLGVHKAFVIGPMCGINRTTAEPPCHIECARWSAINCPFLANPEQARRDVPGLCLKDAPGFALQRNPGVALLWTTKTYSLFRDDKGEPLIHIGDPEAIEWFCQGRSATRDEILNSIETGMPALMTLAMQQEGAVKYLLDTKEKFIQTSVPA